MSLTETQRQILQFIQQHCAHTGSPPSYREIQAHFGYKAIGTVQDHVKALMKKGMLEQKQPGRARALVPAGGPRESVKRIPIYGEIAAGSTRDTPQVELGGLVVSESLAKGTCFALRVVGDSMIEAGILEGDLLIVERSADARSGDIVVALLGGETTVKRYREEKGRICLVPENRRLQPLWITNESFAIQGKVIGLQRKF